MVKEFLYSQCYLPRSCAACICPFRQRCSGVVGHPMGSSSADIDQCPRAVNQYRYRMCPCRWRMNEMGKKRAPSDFQKQIFSRKWAIDAQSTKAKVEHECGRFELYCYWMSQNSLFFSNIENEYCCYNQLNYTNKENQIWRQRGHKQYHRCHKVLKYISAKHRLPKFHSTTRGKISVNCIRTWLNWLNLSKPTRPTWVLIKALNFQCLCLQPRKNVCWKRGKNTHKHVQTLVQLPQFMILSEKIRCKRIMRKRT